MPQVAPPALLPLILQGGGVAGDD